MVHLYCNTSEEFEFGGRYGGQGQFSSRIHKLGKVGTFTRKQRGTRRGGLEVEKRQPPTAGPFERFRGKAAMKSGFEEQPEDYGMDPPPKYL